MIKPITAQTLENQYFCARLSVKWDCLKFFQNLLFLHTVFKRIFNVSPHKKLRQKRGNFNIDEKKYLFTIWIVWILKTKPVSAFIIKIGHISMYFQLTKWYEAVKKIVQCIHAQEEPTHNNEKKKYSTILNNENEFWTKFQPVLHFTIVYRSSFFHPFSQFHVYMPYQIIESYRIYMIWFLLSSSSFPFDFFTPAQNDVFVI